jgi:signal transduction histidine kinase
MGQLWWFRYLIALFSVAAAAVIEWLLWPYLRPHTNILLFTAVVLSAMYGGMGPGLLATALSVLATFFLFFPPEHWARLEFRVVLEAIIFSIASILVTSLSESRRRYEAASQAAKEAAEAANAAKDRFLATATHELRTPLAAIQLWAQLLKKGGTPEELREAIGIIEEQARTELQLVEDILDASRITHDKLRVEMHPVELKTILTTAVHLIEPSAHEKDIRITSDLSAEAGVLGDEMRLQQIFGNLLSNAIKFTPRGGQVRVMLAREGEMARVSIIDNGKGIEATFMPLLFERFWQADCLTSPRHAGLGLGLFIVKHLTEQHGGAISARSDGPGRGATFTVAFPLLAPVAERTRGGGRMIEPAAS